VVVLGAGRGLASVLRALHGTQSGLTAIVSIAHDGPESAEAPQRRTAAAVEDLRRSLEALTGEPGALLRAIRRPLSMESLGRHPLGNLVIASVAEAFGDYAQASVWLGEQLGVEGAVLPATVEPVRRRIETVEVPAAESSGAPRKVRRLQLVGDRLESPQAAVAAIGEAQWVLLAPGALYRSVLSTAAVPDLASALERTSGTVVWLANLEPETRDAPALGALEQLMALRLHGVRVDVVLYDPAAGLRFDPDELASHGIRSAPCAVRSHGNPALHDSARLREAISALTGSRPASTVAD
jgi:uncharacterized cofD-like protein